MTGTSYLVTRNVRHLGTWAPDDPIANITQDARAPGYRPGRARPLCGRTLPATVWPSWWSHLSDVAIDEVLDATEARHERRSRTLPVCRRCLQQLDELLDLVVSAGVDLAASTRSS